MKKKIDKLYVTEIKNVCSAKDMVKGMKKQTTDGEEIFIKHTSGIQNILFLILKQQQEFPL